LKIPEQPDTPRRKLVTDSAQRATLVMERNFEDGDWSVVAYLIRDSGQRTRRTVTRRETREEAADALDTLWEKIFAKKP
jgi:hypothetical protein